MIETQKMGDPTDGVKVTLLDAGIDVEWLAELAANALPGLEKLADPDTTNSVTILDLDVMVSACHAFYRQATLALKEAEEATDGP